MPKKQSRIITILNRRELAVTYSIEQQAKIREALSAGGIPYDLRVVSHLKAGSRSRSDPVPPHTCVEKVRHAHSSGRQTFRFDGRCCFNCAARAECCPHSGAARHRSGCFRGCGG